MKFGKLPAKYDPRTLVYSDYILPDLMPEVLPPSVYWFKKLPTNWGKMKNDVLNDCTCATAGHQIMNWTANANLLKTVPDEEIIKTYTAVSGYDPQTGAKDQGAFLVEVLKYWRKNEIGGGMIDGFVVLERKNIREVMESVYMFGGCSIGLQLPATVLNKSSWVVPSMGPAGVGVPNASLSHAVPVVGYDTRFFYVVSWGGIIPMTYEFYRTYSDEAYAAVSKDWLNAQGKNPLGFDLEKMLADVKNITAVPTTVF